MTLTHSSTSSRNRPTDPPSPRLDVTQLVPVIQGLFTAGLAESTRKAYQAGGIRYSKFCWEAGLTPYPASEEVLLFFIAHLHQEKLDHGTIKSYLAAICYGQIQRGMGNLAIHSMPQVECVWKGAKKATSVSMRRCLLITPPILAAMKRVWKRDPNPCNAKMLWAASCLCFSSPERLCAHQRVRSTLYLTSASVT